MKLFAFFFVFLIAHMGLSGKQRALIGKDSVICVLLSDRYHYVKCLQGETKCKEIDDHNRCSPSSLLRSMGSLQQALVCFEKRLVVAHELGGEGGGKAQAYWELGTLHSQLGNYEQSLSCLEHQLSIARTAGVRLHLRKALFSAADFSSCPSECDNIIIFLNGKYIMHRKMK